MENARLAKENAALQRKLHVLTLDYARVSSELQALRRCLGSVASTPVVPSGGSRRKVVIRNFRGEGGAVCPAWWVAKSLWRVFRFQAQRSPHSRLC